MLVIGHRGASAAAEENTPEAFELADRMGADGVELDVRIAADERGRLELVVHHDPLPADRGALGALPRLDTVLDACGDRMLVNVEIKNSDDDGGHDPTMAVVAPTLAALRARGPSWRDRLLISSFSMATIDHCRRVAPELATAFLTMLADDDAIERSRVSGHQAIHPHHLGVDAALVERCHRAGLAVNIWTANDVDRIRELADMGVDGACTDVPDLALDALGRGDEPAALNPRWGTPG